MIQIISIGVIVLIAGAILIRNKEEISIFKIILTGLFLAIALIISMFSVPIVFVGSQVVVRFSQMVLIVLGAALGPVYGLVGGIGYDVLNLLLKPLGSYYVGFSLNNILVTAIPAFIFMRLKKKSPKFNVGVLSFVSLSYLVYIITVLLLFLNVSSVSDLNATALAQKGLIFLIVFLIVTVIAFIVIKKKGITLDNDFILLMISTILVEFIIQGFLTPLWLSDMAKTPILISMQIRAIKGIPMVFINTFLGYPILKLVRRFLSK